MEPITEQAVWRQVTFSRKFRYFNKSILRHIIDFRWIKMIICFFVNELYMLYYKYIMTCFRSISLLRCPQVQHAMVTWPIFLSFLKIYRLALTRTVLPWTTMQISPLILLITGWILWVKNDFEIAWFLYSMKLFSHCRSFNANFCKQLKNFIFRSCFLFSLSAKRQER